MTRRLVIPAMVAALAVCLFAAVTAAAEPLRVGSKRFTESYVLAEIAKQTAEAAHTEATHIEGLGGSAITFRALENGSIDLYPDYIGTLAETALHDTDVGHVTRAELERELAAHGLGLTSSLGFENKYALAMTRARGEATHTARLSDLALSPALRIGLSHEFLGRADGWPGLSAEYGLGSRDVQAIDHGLAYQALLDGAVDVIDAYSTDAKIATLDLRLLDDDRHFFPSYEACFVYRLAAQKEFPAAFDAIDRLAGTIDVDAIRAMNGDAERTRSFAGVAHDFLAKKAPNRGPAPPPPGFLRALVRSSLRYGPRHVELVFAALFLATLIGVPLGVFASRRKKAGAIVLGATSLVQTIPSLALLAICIPVFGIGVVPALVALFVYALLPIARNTFTALHEIPSSLRESAEALGLTRFERLRLIELPLASRTILAGIKTSAAWTVGTATIAAFIGAGGFGEPISIGLNLNDTELIMEGAIPAAALALLVQGLFVLVDRVVVPRGLRIASAREAETS